MVSVFSSLRQFFKGLLVLVPVLIGLAFISPAEAVQWDAETLTVPVNPDGAEVTFTDREINAGRKVFNTSCLLYTSPSPRDGLLSRMPSSA